TGVDVAGFDRFETGGDDQNVVVDAAAEHGQRRAQAPAAVTGPDIDLREHFVGKPENTLPLPVVRGTLGPAQAGIEHQWPPAQAVFVTAETTELLATLPAAGDHGAEPVSQRPATALVDPQAPNGPAPFVERMLGLDEAADIGKAGGLRTRRLVQAG